MKIVQKNFTRTAKVTRNFFMCLLIATAAMNCSNKDDDHPTHTDAADVEFMTNASFSNLAEVDAGTLASAKGDAEGVRQFGAMMVTDHRTAQDELKGIARRLSVNLPLSPDSAHIAMKQSLMNMSGKTFDTTYMHAQVMDHDKTIALFQSEISNGRDSSTKSYATKYLPIVQMHRMMADSLLMALQHP